MVKILYVIPRLAKAGTERHLLMLSEGLDKKEFRITICCLFEFGEFDKNFSLLGVDLICLGRKNVYDLRVIFDLFRLIKKNKYDIVHAYLFGFQYLAVIPARVAKVPVIISSRRELAKWKKRHHRFLENLANLFTDKIIAVSEIVREYTLLNERISGNKIITIYNGIKLDNFYPRQKDSQILTELCLKESDRIIGMVANFSAVKNYAQLLRILTQVKKFYPEIKCLLVGDGPLRQDIERQAGELRLEANAIFTGRKDDIARVLSVMEIFVLTSKREGLPNAVLEACACSLPIVSIKVGGIAEIVRDGKNGILLEPGDEEGMAAAVLKLLGDQKLRNDMGINGRRIVEQKFDRDVMIKNYRNLYENLLYHKKS